MSAGIESGHSWLDSWIDPKAGDGPGWDIGPEDTDAAPALPLATSPVMGCLYGWAEQVQGDIALADAKASTLLGWSGTALAVVSTVLVSTGLYIPAGRAWVAPVSVSGLACLAGCVIALVLVLRPRMGGRLLGGGYSYDPQDRGFVCFASVGPAAILSAACADAEEVADPAPVIQRVQLLAGIALAKHLLIRRACTLLLVSMLLLAVAGAVMVASLSGGGA
jgi:hypothetical protein